MSSAAVLIGVIAAALLLLLWAGQRRLMYFPITDVPSLATLGVNDVEPVTFDTADGLRLRGWFFPAAATQPRPTVLVFNGNAGNRAHRVPLATALRDRGFHVLLFDYRGFGDSPGSPTEAGLAIDARAARQYLIARSDVDARRLAYFGESLGAAVAVELATEHPPAALILRSPFTSMTDVGQYHYPFLPVRWLIRDRYDTIRRIGRVRSPLLVVIGERDTIVPAAHSRRLFATAPDARKQLRSLPHADHNDFDLLAGNEMIDGIAQLLEAQSSSP